MEHFRFLARMIFRYRLRFKCAQEKLELHLAVYYGLLYGIILRDIEFN